MGYAEQRIPDQAGTGVSIWMRASWLTKQGYKAGDRTTPSFEKVRDLIGKRVRKLR
jgi:hypothetical protein